MEADRGYDVQKSIMALTMLRALSIRQWRAPNFCAPDRCAARDTGVHSSTGIRRCWAIPCLALLIGCASTANVASSPGNAIGDSAPEIATRNLWTPREAATESPGSEADQAIVDGWRLYRTQRGQEAFNHAMATLRSTDGARPEVAAFKGCQNLRCRLVLPKLTSQGWIPAGRLWLSPKQYVLIVHSPRENGGRPLKRRSRTAMRYFIFHEFHNQTRNTDPYDTISAHRRSVFVPFYMGKPQTDARGNRFVVVVQVAPHDVASRHASNLGHAGPGIEVANNYGERLAHLQALAGIVVAAVVKRAEPQLKLVKHRGTEGLAMLRAYMRWWSYARRTPANSAVALPFVPASRVEVASARATLGQLLAVDGVPTFALTRPPTLVTAWSSLSVPMPQLALRPALRRDIRPSVMPEPRILQPPTPVVRASVPLTMESLILRILGSRESVDRSRNCAIARNPDCPG